MNTHMHICIYIYINEHTYGIPPLLVQAIMVLCHNAKFVLANPTGHSASFILSRGIRQGCPLSPYLFIIVLSALTTDLHSLFSPIHLGLSQTSTLSPM